MSNTLSPIVSGNCTEDRYSGDERVNHFSYKAILRMCYPFPGAPQLDTIAAVLVRDLKTWTFPMQENDLRQVLRPSNITSLGYVCFRSVGECESYFEGTVPSSEKEAIELRFKQYIEFLKSRYYSILIGESLALLTTATLISYAVQKYLCWRRPQS